MHSLPVPCLHAGCTWEQHTQWRSLRPACRGLHSSPKSAVFNSYLRTGKLSILYSGGSNKMKPSSHASENARLELRCSRSMPRVLVFSKIFLTLMTHNIWCAQKLSSMTLLSFCRRFKSRSPCLMAAWYCAFFASGRLVSMTPATCRHTRALRLIILAQVIITDWLRQRLHVTV